MALSLDDKLVIGVSSRALFDLEEENRIYEEQGLEAYSKYQIEHEDLSKLKTIILDENGYFEIEIGKGQTTLCK